ncbi:hypothetical protein HPULCUR_003514 [Helicostylum pulchrum]|uniref:F-box domain-containing protein n=1 Tax=Helicostylum pulchrum TaxID=562976 RepID=A0ABP9XTK7_9FUNG
MDKLPREVLVLINSYLDVPTRISYIRVCKYVYSVVNQALCQHLTLTSPDQFDKVFVAFKQQKEKRHQVSSLQLFGCDLDVFTLLSLPDLFPNLKRLVLDSTIVNSLCYHRSLRQFEKLKNLERLDIIIRNGFNFTVALFSSTTLAKLTYLKIKGIENMAESIRTVVDNIAKIPALTTLELEDFLIGLDDLELIDNGLKNLTKLVLKKVHFINKPSIRIITRGETAILMDRDGKECTIQPNSVLRSFYMSKLQIQNSPGSGALKKKLDSLIQYVTLKYSSLDSLTLEATYLDGGRIYPVHSFQQNILDLISRMSNLTHYAIQLEPLSDSVTHAIEQNENMKLKSIDVRVDGRAIEIQFTNMIKPCYTNTIESLRIKDIANQFRPNFHYTDYMIYHITQFKHLTKLELDTTEMCGHDYGFLVNIIQKMPNLNTLALGKFTCDPIIYPTFNINAIARSNIKNLKLGLVVRRKGTRSLINDIFKFCIKSCPYLVDFEVIGKLHCNWGNINLDFRNNLHIQSLKVDIKGCLFYTFNALSFGSDVLEPYSQYKVPLSYSIPYLDPSLPTPPDLKGYFFVNILSDKYISFSLAEPKIKI